ncbi:FAD-dependent oxidoreductase [Streptomyces sp. NPDC058274]|uniref:FAD-dependent oxidoreductase n=1 Tax=Streptomyces sp. NPDC058274 TaxID=3346416 RepID=UPI0036E44EA3
MSHRILIVGAGLTGLALASGLHRRGLDPLVVEQAPIITEAGWAIGLSKRHLVALDRLGITGRERWGGYKSDRTLVFDGRTGVVEHVLEDSPVMFNRSNLQLSLLEGVAGLVRTGVRPSALTDHGDSVEVEFDDGRRERFDAVIGCDGINSWTRLQALGGPEATYTGTAELRFQAPNPDPGLTVTAVATGGDATLAYFLMDEGTKLQGIMFLHGPENNRRELTLAQLADRFPAVAGPLIPLMEIMRTTNPPSFYTNVRQAVVDTWVRNRVAIAGDAAHAMTTVVGQGAGAGFEDAALLADLLTTPHLSIPPALASFEALRKPEAQFLQRYSHGISKAMSVTTSPRKIFTSDPGTVSRADEPAAV